MKIKKEKICKETEMPKARLKRKNYHGDMPRHFSKFELLKKMFYKSEFGANVQFHERVKYNFELNYMYKSIKDFIDGKMFPTKKQLTKFVSEQATDLVAYEMRISKKILKNIHKFILDFVINYSKVKSKDLWRHLQE